MDVDPEKVGRELDRLLSRARAFLALRQAVAGGARGLMLGLVVAIASVAVLPLRGTLGVVMAALIGVSIPLTASVAGAVATHLRRRLSIRETAWLLDLQLQTDALLVGALDVLRTPHPAAGPVAAEVQRLIERPVSVRRALPLRFPKELLLCAALLPLWLVVVLIPLLRSAPERPLPADPVAATGARLENRLLAFDEEGGTPELLSEAEAIAAELEAGALSAAEATERLRELTDRIAETSAGVAAEQRDLPLLVAAADAVAGSGAVELAQRLRDGELEGAAASVRSLGEQLARMAPEERTALGRQLHDAGMGLRRAEDDQLRMLGEALARSGQDIAGDGSPQASLAALAHALEQSAEAASALTESRDRLRAAEQLSAAVRAASGQLGTDLPISQRPGTGPVAAVSTPEEQRAAPAAANDAVEGDHHTELADFARLYDAARRLGASGELARLEGALGPGRVDRATARLTAGSGATAIPLVEVPDSYASAVDRAIDSEEIPAAYRDAVQRYFDDLESGG